jgi:hypothetical protein
MPGSAEFVQRAVHAIEAGAASVWVRRGLAVAGVLAIAVIFMYNFRGLATSQAMDQAQIGRSIARGQGWHTNYIRPRAIGQLQSHGKDVTSRVWTDTYSAPLPPLVDAIALLPVKKHWKISTRDFVYSGDRAIAIAAILLFFGSLVIQFFTAWRLFDRWLALVACTLVLLCDTMWQYALSGLPQMLLLFLFNATLYVLVRAIEAKYRGGAVGPWLVAVGAGFGLLALTHGLTIWIFIPVLIVSAFFFRPRGWAAALALSAFLVLYVPWLIRNWIVCGNPAGLAFYSVLDGLGRSETSWLRDIIFNHEGVGPAAFRDKMLGNIIVDMGRIFEFLGWSVVAVMFFASALHLFRRTETNIFRWFLFAMWVGAVLGMAVFGLNEEQGVASNQLHLLFIPLMTCYGLAWLMVQWNRLGLRLPFARTSFVVLLFLLCTFPIINSLYGMLLGSPRIPLRWPPYVPPSIGVINDWMAPNEITASDMPWAVAWYADRPSILVPSSIKTVTDLSDYGTLGAPIVSLYLTPVSGSDNKLRDIIKGEYHEWMPAILRTDVSKLPFKWGSLALGFENECVFLADHDRSHGPAK